MKPKMIAITQTFDLYDGSKQHIGRVARKMNVNMLNSAAKFVLEDKDGNILGGGGGMNIKL